MSQQKLAVYIGRFSPIHNGHMSVIRKALRNYERLLIIVGSSFQSRTSKNPWTCEERASMIRSAVAEVYGDQCNDRIDIVFARDFQDDMHWLNQINGFIEGACDGGERKPFLIGSDRDATTYYLSKYFPHLKKDLVEPNEALKISATVVRRAYFGDNPVITTEPNPNSTKPFDDLPVTLLHKRFIPECVLAFLERWRGTSEYADLKQEYEYFEKYHESWKTRRDGGSVPYTVNFVTADAVVTQAGHVLLIQRKAAPGKGLWALPGGFVNTDERLLDAAVRELREETKLKVPEAVLRGSIANMGVFDKPDRSLRGRTITHAFHFKLAELGELPQVKGSDDAKTAKWVLLSSLPNMREQMFEDHLGIIENLTGTSL